MSCCFINAKKGLHLKPLRCESCEERGEEGGGSDVAGAEEGGDAWCVTSYRDSLTGVCLCIIGLSILCE